MSRPAIAKLSEKNLFHNIDTIRKAAPNKKIMAMIKANGYGHGLCSIAVRIADCIDNLGVASIDEALAVRQIVPTMPITLIEGVFEPEELLLASVQGFHVVFHNQEQVDWLEAMRLPIPLNAWLKIDTGMGRLGFDISKAVTVYRQLSQQKNLVQPIGVMSHLACANDKNNRLNQKQIIAFNRFTARMQCLKSFANSAAIFNFPLIAEDVVRVGIALYGVSPDCGKSAEQLNLRPVMSLQSRLIAVKTFKKGDSIGYGAEFICPENMPVGVAALGYGDGYPRTARMGTPVLVNNRRCQLIGRVSMDMLTIDLRQSAGAKIGDPVILWGHSLPIEEVATYTENSAYDLLAGVQQRVKFCWVAGD